MKFKITKASLLFLALLVSCSNNVNPNKEPSNPTGDQNPGEVMPGDKDSDKEDEKKPIDDPSSGNNNDNNNGNKDDVHNQEQDHVHEKSQIINSKYLKNPATCKQPATYHFGCLHCDYIFDEIFEAGTSLDHYFIEIESENALASESTCNELRKYYLSCIRCGELSSDTFTAQYGNYAQHSFVVIEEAIQPTCQSEGRTAKYQCKICGITTTPQVIAKTFHLFEHVDYIAPTCSTPGYEDAYRCTVCGFTTGNKISGGHNYVEAIDSKYLINEATCSSQALYAKSCSECGEASDEDFFRAGPLKSHEFIHHDGKDATCLSSGTLGYDECQKCGLRTNEPVSINPKHRFVNDRCTSCDKTIIELANNYYYQNGFNSYANGAGMRSFYQDIENAFNDLYLDTTNGFDSVYAFDYGKYGLSIEEAFSVGFRVVYDNPLFYFVDNTYSFIPEESKFVYQIIEEYKLPNNRQTINEKINKYLNDFQDIASSSKVDIIANAHDFILDKIDYAYDDKGAASEDIKHHSIVGVVTNDGAVCEGYSKSFQLLLDLYNIESINILGKGGKEDHSWNMVKVNNNYYYMDLTWDDVEFDNWNEGATTFENRYHYFLKGKGDETVDGNLFTTNHIPATSNCDKFFTSRGFNYNLPTVSSYFGYSEPSIGGEFINNGFEYKIISSYSVQVIDILQNTEEVSIPNKITHSNKIYTVTAMGNDYASRDPLTIPPDVKYINIPETIEYIYNGFYNYDNVAINGETIGVQTLIKEYRVDENNKFFTSIDGVVYTKDKTILMIFPHGSDMEELYLPDETLFIMHQVLTPFSSSYDTKLKKISFGPNFIDAGLVSMHNLIAGEMSRILETHRHMQFEFRGDLTDKDER